MEDPVKHWALCVSALGFAAFTVGYFLPSPRFRRELPDWTLDTCEDLAWKATVALAIPAMMVAVRFAWYRAGVSYGEGQGLSFLDQAVLYTHLFFGFLYLGATEMRAGSRRRIFAAAALITLPRLIISLQWGRFFFAQAVVPILFIAIARGWIHMGLKRWLQLGGLALVIVFVPAITRGDRVADQRELVKFFAAGSSLERLQDNAHLDLANRCPPLLISLTDKVVPYQLLQICTVEVWGQRLPATLDRILTHNDVAAEGTGEGTGSNFLLELYLSGGLTVVILGSLIFGYTDGCFVDWIGRRSLFAGIWAECLSRSLFAPRSTVGYVYERVPSLVPVTFLVVLIAAACRKGSSPSSTAGPKRLSGDLNEGLSTFDGN